jgi:4'-phosphopantetheinyl transferase
LSAEEWAAAPSGPIPLPPGELHVWRAPLELPGARHDALCSTLSTEEIGRAARFRTPELSARFLAGRGVVRAILAHYLEADPAALRFTAGERGKPALTGEHAWLHFNASNSAGLALVAVARDRAVGVDVEERRPVPEALAIADRMLSRGECARLRALPPSALETAFLDCWTRKEAYIKAIGTGLWTGLDRFEVAIGPGAEPALLTVDGSPEGAARWALRALDPGPGYAAAVVAEAPVTLLRRYHHD